MSKVWEGANKRMYQWGVAGKSCDRAGWTHNIVSAFTNEKQQAAASVFLDLHKFYECISHRVLWEQAKRWGFPLHLLRACLMMYSGFRACTVGGITNEPFRAYGTIIAGCSSATAIAKLLTMTAIDAIARARPSVKVTNMADDVVLQGVGGALLAILEMLAALQGLLANFVLLMVPIAQKKTDMIANSNEVELGLVTGLPLFGR